MKNADSILRDPNEMEDVYHYNIGMLRHLCVEFDQGRVEAALWIAVVLRTLLHTYQKSDGKYSSHALVDQMKEAGKIGQINFIDSAFPMPSTAHFTQGWRIGDHVCGINVQASSIYAGLIYKTINAGNGKYIVDAEPNLDVWNTEKTIVPFDKWWNKNIVFYDAVKKRRLTRFDIVRNVANRDGGAHFDPEIPVEYDTFRHPDLWKVQFGDKEIPFTKNPVHVSLRQIAWEVLKSLE